MTSASKFSDLGKRLASALLLLVLFGAIILTGGWLTKAFIALLFGIMVYEWIAIWCNGLPLRHIILSAILAVAIMFGHAHFSGIVLLTVTGLFALALTLPLIRSFSKDSLLRGLWFFIGFIYIGLFPIASFDLFGTADILPPFVATPDLSSATTVTNDPGPVIPWGGLFLLSIVIAVDVGGYFGGRIFGGPKLLPAVSPSKTWSGFITALALATCVLLLWQTFGSAALETFQRLPSPGLNMGFLALASLMGDMFQSFLKRRANIKDSGRLLPGHGGVFDRLDGYIAASGLAWMLSLVS